MEDGCVVCQVNINTRNSEVRKGKVSTQTRLRGHHHARRAHRAGSPGIGLEQRCEKLYQVILACVPPTWLYTWKKHGCCQPEHADSCSTTSYVRMAKERLCSEELASSNNNRLRSKLESLMQCKSNYTTGHQKQLLVIPDSYPVVLRGSERQFSRRHPQSGAFGKNAKTPGENHCNPLIPRPLLPRGEGV